MIVINFEKAKQIAHEKRRLARQIEFAPHDEVIAKQIPGDAIKEAEQNRAEIRKKYADLQAAMDAATSLDELKSLLPNNI